MKANLAPNTCMKRLSTPTARVKLVSVRKRHTVQSLLWKCLKAITLAITYVFQMTVIQCFFKYSWQTVWKGWLYQVTITHKLHTRHHLGELWSVNPDLFEKQPSLCLRAARVCLCESARPPGCCFGRLPSFRCPYRLPGLHGGVQACFPLQVDTDAALRGQPRAYTLALAHTHTYTHMHLNTYKHGNTIVSPTVQRVRMFLETPAGLTRD